MYLDLSGAKLVVILVIVAFIGAGIALFVVLNSTADVVDRGMDFFTREFYDGTFWLEYEAFAGSSVPTATAATSSDDAQAIPILLYHGEGANANMPLSVFVDQLRALYADGWRTITMEQFEAFMKDGAPVPAKSFLLAFDDGRKDTFYSADPLLQELHYTAVMFVITGFSLPADGAQSDYYLDRSELQYMVDSGRWELESHGDQDHRLYSVPTSPTATSSVDNAHFLSNLFWLPDQGGVESTAQYETRVTGDLETSKQILEQDFGINVIGFAYPFNDYGDDSVNFPESQSLLAQIVPSIYTFAFIQVDPAATDIFNYPDPSAYLMERVEPSSSWSGAQLVALLDGDGPRALPYAAPSFGQEWLDSWGSVEAGGSALSLSATPQTSGALSILAGSEDWTDYQFSATVNWQDENSEISLIARYDAQTDTYLACAFSQNEIYLQEHESGTQTTIASGPYQPEGVSGGTQLSMSVGQGSATCAASGGSVTGSFSEAAYAHGSIGIQAWDPQLGAARIQVESVSVQAI